MAPATKPTTKTPSVKLGVEVTPVGSALFVSAPRASMYDETKQEAKLVLSAEDYEAFLARINALLKEHESELPVAINKLKLPFKEALDQDENPTGEMILSTKTAMKYPARFYDKNGNLFNPGNDFQVANRSKIRLAVGLEVVKTSLYTGVVARLNGIKIISSTPWTGANPFGGTEDEGDFVYGTGTDFPDSQSASEDWID